LPIPDGVKCCWNPLAEQLSKFKNREKRPRVNILHLTGRFAIGMGAPDAAMIADIKAQGFSSVVSLRNVGEPNEAMAPEGEAQAVEREGMTWLHFPPAPPQVGEVNVTDALSRKLQDLPAPLLIHCASGARAAGMAVAICAVGENWGFETAMKKATEAGIAVPPLLASKLADYVAAKQG